ncbi:Crp/Fnr family transcriptional regulator [Pseudalkalibacillus caeni]|uniref:Crp/Fnr family transcriptional regulator n=1 Tax=Exobacillus caeni TaxID=2574798 RepID=A0A5R9F494_9BACL|nr:Crp/Fnr family transcriptional regulator [Pseudalkalibacillus caeni]TLS37831.1 Crp/Fnr family transcriptional regulator [Pseudalkalibacillus caeni]
MPEYSLNTHLKKIPLFKELTEDEIDKITHIALTRKYRQRMLVFMQGDPLDRVFFIISGKVKIYKTDSTGKEQIVSILQDGEMFPHAGFFRKGDYPAHAEVVEPSTMIVIPVADFEKILLENPEVCMKLFRVMGEKIIDLQHRLEEQIMQNTYEQILSLLLRLCKLYGSTSEKGVTVLNTHFTNKELANMIGTSRETVSRTLTQLKKKKLVNISEKGFIEVMEEDIKEELMYEL